MIEFLKRFQPTAAFFVMEKYFKWLSSVPRSLILINILVFPYPSEESLNSNFASSPNESYNPIMLSSIDSYQCSRMWMTHQEAILLKESLSELVNIRNITYPSFRSFYKICKEHHSHNKCPCISRSPFHLHWSFPSVLTCLNNSNTADVLLHLYISFETILDKIMIPNQPISRTVSVLGIGESGKENQFVKLLSPNMRKPNVTLQAATLKMREFHNIFPSYTAVAKLTVELVTWRNLTIIFPSDSNNPYDKEILVPGVYPRLFANAIQTNNLNRSIYYEGPTDGQTDTTDYNFLYCAAPQKGQANIWDFSPLTYPFDKSVWIVLIGAAVTLSALIFLNVQLEVYFLLKIRASFSTSAASIQTLVSIAWSLISVLISGPSYFGLKFSLQRSFLFVTWLFSSLILSNFYTGLLTSLLIQPIPARTLEDLKDLVEHGYTFIFGDDSPNVFDTVLETVKNNKLTRINRTDYIFPSTDYDLMEILVTNQPENQYLPDAQFIEKSAFEPKSAVYGTWLYGYWILQRTTQFIKSKATGSEGMKPNIACHFGKKMLPAPSLFWGFYPPNVAWLYETYLGFSQSGIEDLWLREFYGLNFAKRVQDRSTVLSKTELAPDPETTKPKPIRLDDGHFLTVVMLGIVCVLTSICVFLLEVLFKRAILTKVSKVEHVVITDTVGKQINRGSVQMYSFIH